ncbi:MAG: Cypemycin methyltransferase [Pelotomaculum sp. PtaB.Bin104]|nr:MAG: Cypemycin methyltransferase [Pelotomaculum sp. PtaB.Bin104]
MNFELFKKPKPFEPGDENIWTDPYVSRRLLEEHLKTDCDAASRKLSTIRKTVEWFDGMLPRNAKILDLGCGPGLYAEQFAELGHRVIGIDINRNSIAYASENAKNKNLKIEYINESYFEITLNEQFDAVIMIYCDMGTHSNEDRDKILRQIRKYLKPNGRLIFDVFTEKLAEVKKENRSFEYCDGVGFWANRPHLVLSETFHYKEASLFCYQYIVITKNAQKVYRVWEHYYSEDEIKQLLFDRGYKGVRIETGLIPENDFTSNEVMFIICE